MIFKNNKKTPTGSVLKLFKVVRYKDLSLYNPQAIKNAIKLFIDSFFEDSVFDCIELNYGVKTYKKLTVFLEQINEVSGDLEICDLIISSKEKANKILYSNSLLNQVHQEGAGVIEFDICSGHNDISKDKAYAFIKALLEIFPIDYGYVLPLEKGMDVRSERIVKSSFWGSSVSVTKEDILRRDGLLNLNDGFLPKLYPINILNQSQFDNIENGKTPVESITEIDGNLKLVVINNILVKNH